MNRPLLNPLFVFALWLLAATRIAGVYALPRPLTSSKNITMDDEYHNRYIPTSHQWECDDGKVYTTLLSPSLINNAMERSVNSWARNIPTMWGNGRSYPHSLGTSNINGWNLESVSAECRTTYVGSAPVVQNTIGGVAATSPGTYRVLISDDWTSQRENGQDYRVYSICGVVSYKSYGRVGGYEMCKNFASMEESEDLGQLTIF